MPEPAPKPGAEEVAPFLMAELEGVLQTAIDRGGKTKTSRSATFPAIQSLFTERVEQGREKYGTTLMTWNGRNALRDAWEECFDLCFYLKQALMEGYPEEAIRPAFMRALWNLFDLTRALCWQDPELGAKLGYVKPNHSLADRCKFPDYRQEGEN